MIYQQYFKNAIVCVSVYIAASDQYQTQAFFNKMYQKCLKTEKVAT